MKTVVFHIVSHFDLGGAERVALNIAKSDSKDFEYHILEVARGDSTYTIEMIKELESCGIQYHRANVKNNKIAILLFPFRLKTLCKKYNPQVIHTHTEVPDLSLFIFSKIFPSIKYKHIRTLHNTVLWQGWELIGSKVEKWVIQNNANVSISISVLQSYKKKYGVIQEIPLIFNGFCEYQQIKYDGLNKKKINILFAGRFVVQKGIKTLIEIVENVDENVFDFTIAGVGPLSDMLLSKLNKRSNVNIIPPILNLSSFLASFDYVIIPSEHDGLNSLSIESSFNGTPVIINDIGGLNDTLPKDWPLKVKNNNVTNYKEIFNNLLNVDRNELINKAYTFVNENFSLSRMQKKYEKLYIKNK